MVSSKTTSPRQRIVLGLKSGNEDFGFMAPLSELALCVKELILVAVLKPSNRAGVLNLKDLDEVTLTIEVFSSKESLKNA